MICPYCNVGVRFEPHHLGPVHNDGTQKKQMGYQVAEGFCPECHGFVVLIRRGQYWVHDLNDADSRELMDSTNEVIYPFARNYRPLPPEVPEPCRADFAEACAVLSPSPKASVAISRRILQHLLRDELKIMHKTLDKEIAEFISRPGVPSPLAEAVDAIRVVGNFAAHPTKNTSTGEVIDVEPGEANWLIEVLESLFDFLFVQPKRLTANRASLNSKLASAGRPPVK
jgi:hypothetical protein